MLVPSKKLFTKVTSEASGAIILKDIKLDKVRIDISETKRAFAIIS